MDAVRASITEVRDPFDYRDLPAGQYRAVHLVLGEPSRRVEVQIRTVAQHLWADACERFGERAKEGEPTGEEQTFLNMLGVFCIQTDAGVSDASDQSFLSRYRALHADQLVRCERFPSSAEGRLEALDFYRYQVRSLPDNEFDVLVFNSSSEKALKVTHPRYFPE